MSSLGGVSTAHGVRNYVCKRILLNPKLMHLAIALDVCMEHMLDNITRTFLDRGFLNSRCDAAACSRSVAPVNWSSQGMWGSLLEL